MARSTLSVFMAVASASYIAAQLPTFLAMPLALLSFTYPSQLPYEAVPDTYVRGAPTISATRPLRITSPCVRLRLSTALLSHW